MVWVRRIISCAARRVKVSIRMRAGSTPFSTRCAVRCARVLVLPVPAPAKMSSGPASTPLSGTGVPKVAARRCCGLSESNAVALAFIIRACRYCTYIQIATQCFGTYWQDRALRGPRARRADHRPPAFVGILLKATLEHQGPSMSKPTRSQPASSTAAASSKSPPSACSTPTAGNTTWTSSAIPAPRRWSPWTIGERVCLVRQYRHGVDGFPVGNSRRQARCRRVAADLRQCANWPKKPAYPPGTGPPWDCSCRLPAIFTEVIHLYLARDLESGPPAPDADEELELNGCR